MSREIKFRAWNKVACEMIDPADATPEGFDIEGVFLPFHENIILMQFTGLSDKNGVEIYEGDVIERHMPYRDSQTHYGENIPHPSGSYTEPLTPEIRSRRHAVTFRDGMFTAGDFQDCALWYEAQIYQSVEHLIDDFGGDHKNWPSRDDESGDLDYLLSEYPPNNIEELLAYCSGCEVIGNIYEDGELVS